MKHTTIAKLFASAALLAYAAMAIPQTKQLCEGFLPPNDMKIPVGTHIRFGFAGGSGITEAQYNTIMDKVSAIYAPVVKARGGTFVINRLWTDDTVNSSAQQQGGQWIINMYGGIARHPDVTIEGETLIACHETGHHLGGAPKESGMGGAWATDEGGADYFATLKCMRNVFAGDDNATIIAGASIDPLARTRCTSQFTAKADQDICMRISMGAESVSYLFQDLSKEKTRPQFNTPDPSQVSTTNDDHPATQCRMDTYFNGGICSVAVSVPNSDTDFKAGTCVEGVDQLGFRPRCWFSATSTGGGGGGGGGGGTCPLGDQSLCDQLCQIDPTLPFCP
jgi:hypothetical protein